MDADSILREEIRQQVAELLSPLRQVIEDKSDSLLWHAVESFTAKLEKEVERLPGIIASPYLNKRDAAAWCGCTIPKFDARRRKGHIEEKTFGLHAMFLKKDLERVFREDTAAKRKRAVKPFNFQKRAAAASAPGSQAPTAALPDEEAAA